MMKKLVILIALVAAPAALAAPEPTAVTIQATPEMVTYGNPTTLTGAVTPAQKINVSVAGKTCQNPPARVALASPLTVRSDSTGTWSTTVSPQVRTEYQATSKNAQSETVMVQVRPRVTLAKVGRHTFRTRAWAAASLAGKTALFQKRNAFGWVTVKRVTLAVITATSDTVVSGKTFRSGVSAHKTVRVLLTQRQVGNCYAAGISNAIRS
jgi:hypothetical protein